MSLQMNLGIITPLHCLVLFNRLPVKKDFNFRLCNEFAPKQIKKGNTHEETKSSKVRTVFILLIAKDKPWLGEESTGMGVQE